MHALNNFSSLIDKVSFKKNSMSLGLVVLEKKLFTRTRTPTPQSDDRVMTCQSADIKNDSESLGILVGGDLGGLTLMSEEKVGC